MRGMEVHWSVRGTQMFRRTAITASGRSRLLQVHADSRIIIPGGNNGGFPGRGTPSNQDRQQGNSRLIIPGNDRSTGRSIDTTGIQGPSTSTFRPPPGFMDTANPKSKEYGPFDPSEARQALDRVRAQAGHWHELAQVLPRLAASGYDAQVVEFETGLERVLQNSWIVAQSVHESLQKSGDLKEEVLAFYDAPDGADKLYHLRFLTVQARAAAAQYIADQQYDAVEAGVLGRAVKEHERRDGDKLGFSGSPADCLAFKYYRDAAESRSERQQKDLVEKALTVAETNSARSAIRKLFAEQEDALSPTGRSTEVALEVIRLTGEEVEFRPVVLVGELSEVSSSQVAAAVGVKQSGIYNSFRCTADSIDQEFVALPAFRSLLFAKSPVALSIADCSLENIVLKATGVKNDEEKRKQSGPGLVVLDRAFEADAPVPSDVYVQEHGAACKLVTGSDVSTFDDVLGRVLFICRPPARSAAARLNSYALMSV